MLDFRKLDALGAEIRPGDVCFWASKNGLEPVIYRGETRGNGKFGRFYTSEGKTTVRYSSVIFAFDPLSKRRNNSETIAKLIRKQYEGIE